MKKILIALLVLVSFTGFAQKTSNLYSPYADVGISILNNSLSYSGGVGFASTNSRYSVGVTSTTASPDNVWSAYTKGLWKISTRNVTQKVDVYASTAVSIALTTLHPITFEPGLATIFNITKRFAPQVSLGFPIQQNTVFKNRPLAFNAGLSLNYSL